MAQTFVNTNEEIAERVFINLLNGHDLDSIPELYAEDCELYGMTGPEAIDLKEYNAFLEMYFEAFPDLSFDIDEMISDGEDDRVSVRWTSHGSHENDLMGIPATGKAVTVSGISFIHIKDGKIVETYTNHDRLGLLEQLDALPDSPRKIVRLMLGQLKSRLTGR